MEVQHRWQLEFIDSAEATALRAGIARDRILNLVQLDKLLSLPLRRTKLREARSITSCSRTCSQLLVNLPGKQGSNSFLKIRVVHVPSENFFVLVHALHEQSLQKVVEDERELVLWVHPSGLLKCRIRCGSLSNLIEEILIRLLEIRPEAFIDEIDQPR
jgi:hypothetical protein